MHHQLLARIRRTLCSPSIPPPSNPHYAETVLPERPLFPLALLLPRPIPSHPIPSIPVPRPGPGPGISYPRMEYPHRFRILRAPQRLGQSHSRSLSPSPITIRVGLRRLRSMVRLPYSRQRLPGTGTPHAMLHSCSIALSPTCLRHVVSWPSYHLTSFGGSAASSSSTYPLTQSLPFPRPRSSVSVFL